MSPSHLLSLLLLTLLSVATNVTIDDSNTAYFNFMLDTLSPRPMFPWAAITPSKPCSYCSAQPQTTNIENKTWHDGSNGSAGTLTFQGSAVYIYGIDLTNPANITFELDGVASGWHHYDGAEQFVFRALFYAAQGLAAGVNHTVSWVVHATSTGGNVALLDYAVITTDAGNTTTSASSSSTAASSKSKSKAGPIAGGIVGGLAILLLAVGAAFFVVRRRRRAPASATQPFVASTPRPPPTFIPAPPLTSTSATSPASPSNGSGSGEKTCAGFPSLPSRAHANACPVDVSWNSPAPAQSVSSGAPPESASSAVAPESVNPPSEPRSTGPSERERALEERLAQLEAQVAQVAQPPAYEPPPPRAPA
ncbi:hypothetical protein B0H15DRAFT_932714 [Mycena belliarum]|uniref:Uncharacterized protein n=1 Tax=Mycena belliarum TaxID=1033014 RepID=A0AAD6U2H6_9AGAR|nr:hypothetical protein B0H15DRAFT_932714 [Mycena belliae]